jgi:hypothetical protein
MKIRVGFVSNSSSSSFVVKPDITTSDVALIMLNAIIDERKDRYKPEELEKKFGKALEWLHENPNYNDPIMFPWSTTYIWYTNEGIYVETCNNHSWYKYLDFDYIADGCYSYCNKVFLNLADK